MFRKKLFSFYRSKDFDDENSFSSPRTNGLSVMEATSQQKNPEAGTSPKDVDSGQGISSDQHVIKDFDDSLDEEEHISRRADTLQVEVKQVTLSWHQLNVTSKVKKSKWTACCPRAGPPPVFKQLLINVNGEIRPGELLAVMGSSGAGKTTLMNSITGRNLNRIEVSGAILMNGQKITEKMKKLVSYVEQEDIFIGGLTVREHLVFQALLRMKKGISIKKKIERVDEVMEELRLTKCARTVIGIPGRVKGASGGEKKRLAFASELLTNPSVMFCDEPTSGLDSFMAENVVSVLKELANRGRTILCTIHQPSSAVYALFNNVMFLAEGQVAFMGSSEDATAFFESVDLVCPRNFNPADFYVGKLNVTHGLEQESRDLIAVICSAYERSEYAKRYLVSNIKAVESVHCGMVMVEKSRKKNPWFFQCWILYRRSMLSLRREPLLTTVRLGQASLISGIIAVLFWQQKLTQEGTMNMNGAVFMMLTNMTVQNGFAVMTTFCEEIPIFLREYSGGIYRISTYFFGKSAAELPIFVVIPSVTATIIYWSVGLRTNVVSYLNMVVVGWLVANTGVSFGYCISCMTSSPTMAVTIAPPLFVPFMIFGGYFLNVKSVPIYLDWLKYLSWYHYAFEILVINQWASIDYIECDKADKTSCFHNGQDVINYFNFKESNFYFDFWMLGALLVFYRVIAFSILVLKVKLRNVL